jgi:hypothetical protein
LLGQGVEGLQLVWGFRNPKAAPSPVSFWTFPVDFMEYSSPHLVGHWGGPYDTTVSVGRRRLSVYPNSPTILMWAYLDGYTCD